MRPVALMSFWKIKNALRTLVSDPRKLIPVIIVVVMVGLATSMSMLSHSLTGSIKNRPQMSTKEILTLKKQAIERGMSKADAQRLFNPDAFNPLRGNIDPDLFAAGISLCLILLGIGVINTGLGDRLLALGPSDVDYMFPAPISRRVVLAYRMPSLTFGAVGVAIYLLFIISIVTSATELRLPNSGTTVSPWWVNPLALFLSGGIYLNLAMLISIRMPNRQVFQKGLWIGTAVLVGSFAFVAWQGGFETAEKLVQSPALRWIFLPSSLASDTLIAAYSQRPAGGLLAWLLFGYVASLAVMFTSNANWYEQSIASTEKWTAMRQAAKSGWAGVMAARAATYKYKGSKPYTVTPFGTHATALFWAHLCAAAKKPFPNFGIPIFAGVALGGAGATAIRSISTEVAQVTHRHPGAIIGQGLGYTLLGIMTFYCWQGFLTTSRLAAEASIRRRELTSPLPISGWQTVMADMGVPVVAVFLCFWSAVVSYALFGGVSLAVVAVGLGLLIPIRLAGRIVLQYIVVMAYPDLEDKIQRLVSMIVFLPVGLPFLIIEGIVCLPALFLQSIWLALIPLTLIQIPFCALFLFFAGRASEKAIASGEPVSLFGLLTPAK